MTQKDGLLAQLKKRKLSIYGHWKRRPESLVQMTVEGEVEGKARPGRRKTGWIDNIESWTDGGVAVAREKAHKRMPTVPKGLWRHNIININNNKNCMNANEMYLFLKMNKI